MSAYATVADVEAGFRTLTTDESAMASALLEEAAVMIDSYNSEASADTKKVVSCRMVRRAIGAGTTIPMGATQATMSGLGYSQSYTYGSGGSAGELYIGRADKKLLGMGDKITVYSQLEDL